MSVVKELMLCLSTMKRTKLLAGIIFLVLFLIFYLRMLDNIDIHPKLRIPLANRPSKTAPEQNAVSGTHSPNADDDLVVIYNRVPKTGSTSFVNLAYELCKENKFHVLHLNVTANMHVLSLPNQIQFVNNVTKWDAVKPALYHGHLAYLDFTRYQPAGVRTPLYINIVRRPLDRLVSYYYFLRFGDNYRPNLVRRKSGNKITFDDCVKQKQADCNPRLMWLQIPFFCGHHAECWTPESEWALEQAKRNLVEKYFLVGITEQMQEFVELLEMTIPRIFNGSLYQYLHSNKSHLRQTTSKLEPQEETVKAIQETQVWKMENQFYEFAVAQFSFQQTKLYVPDKKQLQTFMYEKVRPKM